jgi:hypothetical protein
VCVAVYPPSLPPCRDGYQRDARGECVAAYHPPPIVPKNAALPTVIATPYVETMKPAYVEPKNAALPTISPHLTSSPRSNVHPSVALPRHSRPPPNVSCDATSGCSSSDNNLSDQACSHSNSTGNPTDRYATNELQPKNFARVAHDRSLSAGIRSLLWNSQRRGPESAGRGTCHPGRDHPGMVGDIISERWAELSRNGWAASFRNHGRLAPESASPHWG